MLFWASFGPVFIGCFLVACNDFTLLVVFKSLMNIELFYRSPLGFFLGRLLEAGIFGSCTSIYKSFPVFILKLRLAFGIPDDWLVVCHSLLVRCVD